MEDILVRKYLHVAFITRIGLRRLTRDIEMIVNTVQH